jgi:hypothetical protein
LTVFSEIERIIATSAEVFPSAVHLRISSSAQGFLSVSANNRLPNAYAEDELELRLRTLTELSRN